MNTACFWHCSGLSLCGFKGKEIQPRSLWKTLITISSYLSCFPSSFLYFSSCLSYFWLCCGPTSAGLSWTPCVSYMAKNYKCELIERKGKRRGCSPGNSVRASANAYNDSVISLSLCLCEWNAFCWMNGDGLWLTLSDSKWALRYEYNLID